MKSMDKDLENIARFKNGDMEVFSDLVRKYQNEVYSFILRMIGSRMDSQDLTQEVFIRVFKGLNGFKCKSLFRTWLFRITINVCRSHFKRNSLFSNNSLDKEGQASLDKEGQASIEEKVIHKEQREALRELISQLPYKQRITLILKIYHELTFLEIARVVDSSIGTVKANFHFALNKLRQEWPKDEM